MSTTAQTLREQRANLWSQMTEIMEIADREKRSLSGEESAKYDRLEKELDDKGDEIARAERYEQRVAEMNSRDRSGLVLPKGDDNGIGAKASGRKVDTPEYRRAFTNYLRNGVQDLESDDRRLLRDGWVEDSAIKNALGVGTSAAGGYTVPLEFRNAIIERMMKIGSVRSVADHIRTDSGVNLPWPTLDDTGNEGAILAENSQVTQQDLVFGTNSLDAYMYTSKLVLVSLQLLNDAGFDIDTKLPVWLGNRLGRVQNRHFTVGTGSSQPDGIVTNATVGKTGATGQTLSLIYDDLIDLIDSIDPAYLEAGNCKWMLGQALRRVVRKIKDNQGRPLWEPSLQAGTPDSLLSYPLVLNNHMPVPAANAKSLLFGDFEQGYIVRDVNDVQVLRLTERYADYLQVGFIAFQRADGTVQNPYSYAAYQHSAT